MKIIESHNTEYYGESLNMNYFVYKNTKTAQERNLVKAYKTIIQLSCEGVFLKRSAVR